MRGWGCSSVRARVVGLGYSAFGLGSKGEGVRARVLGLACEGAGVGDRVVALGCSGVRAFGSGCRARVLMFGDSTGLRHIRRPLNVSGLVAFAALGKPLGGNVDASDGLAYALLGIASL